MDQLINEALRDVSITATTSVLDLLAAIVVSAFLSMVLSHIYVRTHSGHSYSRSFVLSLTLVSITIALIMLIVGSNIARAFALVGAMSIVRFRNPVKDSRDLVFVFMAIAIGMACGTRFYNFAIIFTMSAAIIIFVHDMFGFGAIKSKSYVLRIRMNPNDREKLDEICRDLCDSHFLISLDRNAGERDIEEVVYETVLKKQYSYDDLVRALSEASSTLSVSLLVGESRIEA